MTAPAARDFYLIAQIATTATEFHKRILGCVYDQGIIPLTEFGINAQLWLDRCRGHIAAQPGFPEAVASFLETWKSSHNMDDPQDVALGWLSWQDDQSVISNSQLLAAVQAVNKQVWDELAAKAGQ